MKYRLVDINLATEERTEWQWFSDACLHILQYSLWQRAKKLNLKKVKSHIETLNLGTGEVKTYKE